MMRPVTMTLIALAAGLLAGNARAERAGGPAAGAAPDSLVRALVAPAPSPFAPTVCVVPEDRDVRAVREVLDEQVAAWNRGDLAGYMRGYWKSDSLTFYGGGEITHGWQVTFDRYRRRYQSEGREM
ncbi:MAG TPA: hypothetical protein VMS88_00635, partial [Terriglobales bacterium]|nr:hypothetical protein [Terriglobales bacterium]